MSLRPQAPYIPRIPPCHPSTAGSPRLTPTSSQKGAQPVEVPTGGGPSGSCRLRHRGRGVGRCQGRRCRHQDQCRVGNSGRQFTSHGLGPWPQRAVTEHRPPRGRDGITPGGAARADGVRQGAGPGPGSQVGVTRARHLPHPASPHDPTPGLAFQASSVLTEEKRGPEGGPTKIPPPPRALPGPLTSGCLLNCVR